LRWEFLRVILTIPTRGFTWPSMPSPILSLWRSL
jgi:hypothetical protein